MSSTLLIKNADILVSSASGQPTLISDAQKFAQDVTCELTTAVRANGFGAGLDDLVGSVSDSSIISMYIEQRIRNSFNVMKILQTRSSSPRLTSETLDKLGFVYVLQNPNDPRVYNYFVSITTVAGRNIEATGSIG